MQKGYPTIVDKVKKSLDGASVSLGRNTVIAQAGIGVGLTHGGLVNKYKYIMVQNIQYKSI